MAEPAAETAKPVAQTIRAVVGALPGRIAVFDATGRRVLVNDAWSREATGDAEQLDDLPPAVSAAAKDVLDGRHVQLSVECPEAGRDGLRCITARISRVSLEGHCHVMLAYEPTVERRLSEALSRQAQLERLVADAASAAHQIANALSPITGFSDLLVTDSELEQLPAASRYARAIHEAALLAVEHVRTLHRTMQADAESVAAQPVRLNGAQLVDEAPPA